MKLLEIAKEQDEEFNSRIKELEGTAIDLKHFGFFGKIIIFLRGLQRPLWGYFVIYMDYKVLSGEWKLFHLNKDNQYIDIEPAFWIINFLVLGFLFGERAMRNVLPLYKNIRKTQTNHNA
uniref:Uncharacterized protein n=1 Tax=Candidatus Kentrum sp. LFY TaxID=2126342 RepID=A0A450UNW7_9GAMM|nr:MAG: hypothetical protein BECKLFY1418A_GA0070994_103813 [Candidatus Kentron sp. LFY]